MKKIYLLFSFFYLLNTNVFVSQSNWLEKETKNFVCIYQESQSHLIDHILESAENSLAALSPIFDHKIEGKTTIITFDYTDYGFGAASTVPRNIIRLEIEPFEPGYEALIYNDRIQWTLNHELVHIFVNDKATSLESFFRSLFGKVPPEQTHPPTTIYSLFTNFSRYTPRWHQEGIAVFFETWLSGGYGRSLGSFDEMYFRSFVIEEKEFPTLNELEMLFPHKNFMYQKLYYIYGQRFVTYLADVYSPKKVVEWYSINSATSYQNFDAKFETVFGIPFEIGWQNFIQSEIRFQKNNIDFINSAETTRLKYLSNKPFGWVSDAHFDSKNNKIIFGYHKPHNLASFASLDLVNLTIQDINSLETPSLIQVASTVYNEDNQQLLYTRKNNNHYRDILMKDFNSGIQHTIFENCRTGEIEVTKRSKELWGVAHLQGMATLVRSSFPYKKLESIIDFNYGDEVFDIAIDSRERFLTAIIHRSDGGQSLVLADLKNLRNGGSFQYQLITSKGSPENPSWSRDGKYLYWNSFISGVSNIFKYELATEKISVVTNTERGVVKPLHLGGDSLFVFEFTIDGFRPALLIDKEVERVPAIDYYGQKVFEKFPNIEEWIVENKAHNKILSEDNNAKDYSAIANLSMITLAPIVTGFQSEIVLGLYTRFNDPLYIHDFVAEIGYSPFGDKENNKLHLSAKYQYKGKLELSWEYNSPDFYDLFNKRKRGLTGQQISVGYTGYWKYDNPTKIVQKSNLTIYTGMESINDNLVEVSEPDFGVIETVTEYKSLRRSIGSSDYEKGNTFNLTFRGFGTNPKNFDWSGHVIGEWSSYSTWISNHNIFRFSSAAGYHYDNERILQSRFYFGGFGNRVLENVPVKQYRDVFRFPGLAIYSYDATKFAKISLENNLPPLRFGKSLIGQHFIDYFELSIYTQGLWTQIDSKNRLFINVGSQLNILFKHWFNLESTLSFGIGKAWVEKYHNTEYFISFKLFRN